jgi:HlyD family secretion protein
LIVVCLLGAVAYVLRDRIQGVLAAAAATPVKTGYAVLSRPGASLELTNATGYVVPRTKAAMSAKVAGLIVDLRVDAGSRVEKGELLAKLDDALFRAALKDAEAALASAKAEETAAGVRVKIAERDAAKAKLDLEESKATTAMTRLDVNEARRLLKIQEDLMSKEAGTNDALQQAVHRVRASEAARARAEASEKAFEGAAARAEAEVRGAEARVPVAVESVRRAEAMVETASANLADTEIRAPFSGVVLKKEAEVGEMVVPGLMGGGTTRGAVVTLADFATLEMEVDVFEKDLRHVSEGSPARIALDAYQDAPYPARVRQVHPTADRQKATVVVRVAFESIDAKVLPDMGGRVTFLREGAADSGVAEVLVPASARTTVDGKSGVFAVENDRARFVVVEFGDVRRGGVVAKTALRGGETLVLDPPAGMSEGVLVKREKTDG